jgi:2'-5' RNA ligase
MTTSRRDIGVAIGIPEPYTTELQGWRERLGDPHAADIPPHITLLAPRSLSTDDLGGVERHLQAIAEQSQPFLMHLRGSGSFRPLSPVVFVPLAQGTSECEQLEAKVRSGVLAQEVSFPYHPHVTVAHDLPEPSLDRAYDELASYDARFRVWGFSLFEKGRDSVWRPQQDFPFGAPLPGPALPPGLLG